MASATRQQWFLAVGLIVVACAARLLPHPPNFSPVAAVALFAGAHLASRLWALAVPLSAMLLTDLILGFHATLPAVYLAVALSVLLGIGLRGRGAAPVALGCVAGAGLFFVMTNLAVWAFGGLYPLTGAGLAQCFVLALPFFQNTLLSTLLYGGVLFGAFRLLAGKPTTVAHASA